MFRPRGANRYPSYLIYGSCMTKIVTEREVLTNVSEAKTPMGGNLLKLAAGLENAQEHAQVRAAFLNWSQNYDGIEAGTDTLLSVLATADKDLIDQQPENERLPLPISNRLGRNLVLAPDTSSEILAKALKDIGHDSESAKFLLFNPGGLFMYIPRETRSKVSQGANIQDEFVKAFSGYRYLVDKKDS